MSETTIPEATKDKIFAFLDILDAKGQPIPSIRVIAAEVHASASHVSPALKLWRQLKAEQKAREINTLSSRVLDEGVSKTIDDAMASIRAAVAEALSASMEQYAEADKQRALEAADREATLRDRALEAEMRADQYLQDKGWLARELDTETMTRKAREAEIDSLREHSYMLESELEETKKALASLQACDPHTPCQQPICDQAAHDAQRRGGSNRVVARLHERVCARAQKGQQRSCLEVEISAACREIPAPRVPASRPPGDTSPGPFPVRSTRTASPRASIRSRS